MGAATLFLFIVVPSCLLILYYIRARNTERIKMIENGINPDGNVDLLTHRKQETLRNGIFLIFLSLGVLVGDYVARNQIVDAVIAFISTILMFGGLGFLVNYLILRFWHTK
ncbi:MAG TPA: DUF6249 domain-containing protein [Chryseolinea sp.]|nr:DUF6249 domain-containing protein [Chryseolinea sp.]